MNDTGFEPQSNQGPALPPRATERPARIALHGESREDPYAWLKDERWREVMRDPSTLNPEIRTYLDAENAYADACMAPLGGLLSALFAELKGRIKEDDSTVPAPDGPYEYYRRFETGRQHPIYCRRPRGGGAEAVLLDGNREAEGHSFFAIGACSHSPDHRLIAYTVDTNGSEYHAVRLKDIASGAVLPDRVASAKAEIVWAEDGRTLFYCRLDDEHRPSKVFRHVVGTDGMADALVYAENDPRYYLDIEKTETRQFILIASHDHASTEIRFISATEPAEAPRLIAARRAGVIYEATHHGEQFLIRTNADGAIDFKIVVAPVAAPEPAHWRDFVAHRPDRYVRSLLVFRDFLVRLERAEALSRIVVMRLADGETHEISLDEEAFDLGLVPGFEFAIDTLRFTYSSPTTPTRTFDYNLRTRARTLRKEQKIPGGHDPDAYICRRLHGTALDGAAVPITVLHRRSTPLDGTAPLVLYGYGAYGFAIPSAFSTNRLSLVDRGCVYAIAHVRGGTEGGYRWYLDGKLEKKANTFTDFIAAAEALIAARFTAPGRIIAHGRSAGGLLVGAVANLRPDLFKAVVAEVPFVDALNTMCDATLPLTPPEWTEWGNPIEDAVAFRLIRSYAPYENVAAKAYPHILATAGLTDPRVTYWEPAKWVARLRALKTDQHLLLLRTNMSAGHAGAAGRFDYLQEVAFVWAFILMVCGRAKAGAADTSPDDQRITA